MISISKLLFEKDLNPKTTNINKSPALNQGKNFNNYQNKIQNKIQNSLEKKPFNLSEKEHFDNMMFDKDGLTSQTNKVIDENNFSNEQQIINNLRNEYQNTLKKYEKLLSQVNGETGDYLSRVNVNNPYIGRVINFPNGPNFYVTKQGVAKWISNNNILNSLVSSAKEIIYLDIPWTNDYYTKGTQLPTNPPLIVGTPLKYGQSVGNEGSNVFVSKLIDQNNVDDIPDTYIGCYAASPNNDNMSFIGNKPSTNKVSIQNGNFDQPVLKNDSYVYIGSNYNQVPGWNFDAILVNNSGAWGFPKPYPEGNQCVSIQMTRKISQDIVLDANVTYTLSCYSCGRNCCSAPNLGNQVKIDLYDKNNLISNIYDFTPPVNQWKYYSVNFKVSSNKTYTLFFSGQSTNIDRSSAIQAINIGLDNANGDYKYEDCKLAAIRTGNRYFALQNTNADYGYCALSNSEPAIKQYGEGLVVSKQIPLWSSNTSKQPGNTALLNNIGSLSVINSSGQAVYNSTSLSETPSNYLGCYNDSTNRTLPKYLGSDKTYESCQDLAKKNNSSLFGLQNTQPNGTSECWVGNDMTLATSLGKNNCKVLNNVPVGGGFTNAIYKTGSPDANYFLILQDDGNMVVYKGKGPNDNQDRIWSTGTNGKQQQANPNIDLSKSKYGKNWMASSSTLSAGDFITSTNGDLVLMMETDGNLVLYTYQVDKNCKKMNTGKIGGGISANAVYDIGKTTIPQNMGLIGFVDEDSNLHVYPSDNQKMQNSYSTIIKNVASWAYDISAFGNSSIETCKKECNSKNDCAGFSYNRNGTCWLKNKGMYPFYESRGFAGPVSYQPLDTYVRDKTPNITPIGVSQNTNNIDSITYENYLKGDKMGNKYGLSKITEVQKQQLDQMETKLNLLTKQINDFTNKYGDGASMAENQSKTNVSGLNNYFKDLNKTNRNIISVSRENTNGIQNILKDSDIVVLQKNYDYLFWSILAAGTVLVSMNVVKKQ